jgi:hypothetical protein
MREHKTVDSGHSKDRFVENLGRNKGKHREDFRNPVSVSIGVPMSEADNTFINRHIIEFQKTPPSGGESSSCTTTIRKKVKSVPIRDQIVRAKENILKNSNTSVRKKEWLVI